MLKENTAQSYANNKEHMTHNEYNWKNRKGKSTPISVAGFGGI
jgi:hypothetical protein